MSYEVRGGDTLSAIARRHGTSVDELQRLNRIADPDRIRAGQRLELPARAPASAARSDTAPASPAAGSGSAATVPVAPAAAGAAGAAGAPGAATAGTAAAEGAATEPWSTTVFRLIDAVGQPIVGLLVRLRSAGGQEAVANTDADGCVVPFRCDAPGERIEIHVGRAAHKGGGQKRVGSYVPLPGNQTVKVQSAKQVATTRLRRHDGPPAEPPRTMKREDSGTKIETATRDGNPLTCVKCGECPNDEDLRLGVNAEYREHILAAAKRAEMLPQAVAALISAEAAKDRRGKWRRDSRAAKGSATGLTQFLDRTWIDEALRRGTYLRDKAIKENWLRLSERGDVQFRRNDGTLLTGPGLAAKLRRLIARPRTANDANLQALLDLRYEPEFSINAAMDYAKLNLRQLRGQGRGIDELNDTQRARVMYLCHHLGPLDAARFIENTMPAQRARELLIQQVGAGRAARLCETPRNGDWVATHRDWLSGFMSYQIVPRNFSCSGARFDQLDAELLQSDLISLAERLRLRA